MPDADRVRIHVYDITLSTGRPPLIREIATAMGVAEAAIAEALVELGSRHVLVLQPDGEILMAAPFSAVPTAFVVSTDAFSAYVNCAWDALGAAAMLERTVSIDASCADCGATVKLESDGRSVSGDSAFLHFQPPVRRWWENVVFT